MAYRFKKDRFYYLLRSKSRTKIKEISALMFEGEFSIKKIGSVYYVEYYLKSKNSAPIDIPRHLLMGTTLLIVVRLGWQNNPSMVLYTNGSIYYSYHYYDRIFIENGKHTTYIDSVLFQIRQKFPKDTLKSVNRIKGSKLYYSIIEKCFYSIEEGHGYFEADEHLKHKHQFFASSQNLSFDLFKGIYLIDD